MPFSTRNARYLRISSHTVMPLYIYLDDKHIEWMSDYILQRVLADLRPDIGPMLRAESSMHSSGGSTGAKGSVGVHRGDTYQFAYFFRKNEPHAVLIKSRRFVPAPAPLPVKATFADSVLSPPTRGGRERGEVASKGISLKRVRGKRSRSGKKGSVTSDSEETAEDSDQEESSRPIEGHELRRSRRKRKPVAGGYKESLAQEGSDIEMSDLDPQDVESVAADPRERRTGDMGNTQTLDQGTDAADAQHVFSVDTDQPGPSALAPGSDVSQVFDADAEALGEEKPKMAMKVSYQGFTIYNRCICLVVEPWPPLRDSSRVPSRAPSLVRDETRMSGVPSMAQRGQTPVPLRERTPLFLPEIDARRSLTPAPLPSRILPPVPLFDEAELEDKGGEPGDSMISYSQALKSLGDERAGSADEDENEGDVFLGDADERRGN